jgi:hypothetical protein
MEKLAFTRAYLSVVRLVMGIMHVPLVELLCQVAMGRISALYLVSGARECLCSCPIITGIKYYHFLRSWRR